ncbi:MAG: N-acetylmuramoyl-L-alanine amidase, partial [Planctomycetes bacterium]|nr:N-acetylmuramoyl-L-alanine amidase [Planctomycetota bacterium]
HERPLAIARHPAEKYLAGWCVVLDPGHGGKADVKGYKRGPTGVREAEMNLRVARLLRRLLTDAGAHVWLTRDAEVSEIADDRRKDTHRLRAAFANDLERPDGGRGADLFISLHHNAASKPTANYPTVWFHGGADDVEPSLDPARYVGHRLGAELRCHGVGLTSVLMNDRQMYAGGFAVLRHARVPAFLVEASFFTHPEEEQRLRDAAYNLREAYAIYLGLVEYAYGGRPTQSLPVAERNGDQLVVRTKLDEGLPGWWGSDLPRILPSTVSVFVAGERVPVVFDPKTKELVARATIPTDATAPVELRVHHANLYKHHNWPQRYEVSFGVDGTVRVQPAR